MAVVDMSIVESHPLLTAIALIACPLLFVILSWVEKRTAGFIPKNSAIDETFVRYSSHVVKGALYL